MKLKFLIAAVAALLAVCAVMVYIPLSMYFDKQQTNREFDAFLIEYESNGLEVTADGEYFTRLSYGNFGYALKLLSPYERNLEYFHPKWPEYYDITIKIGSEAVIGINKAPDKNNQDSVYMYYQNGNKKRCYSITGYRILTTVNKAISPNGTAGANTEIK